jgi:hypothetical protein
MVNKIFKVFGLAGLVFLFNACSGIKVITDYDKTVDFSKYKTFEYYGWSQDSDKLLNRFDKERIEKAFGDEFTKRGLKYVESGGDLIVTLFIVTEQKEQTTATTTGMGGGYGYGYGYGGYYGYGPGYGWGGMSHTTYNTYDYTVGTLVVDVYDATEKKLIWESSGEGTINENPKGKDERIPTAIEKIMKPYPVEPAKE